MLRIRIFIVFSHIPYLFLIKDAVLCLCETGFLFNYIDHII